MKAKEFWQEFKDFFEYTVWKHGIAEFCYNLKYWFKNQKNFRKQLWEFRNWDYEYAVGMFIRSLELLRDTIEHGHDDKRSSAKKVAKINELIELINYDYDDDIFEVWKKRNSGKLTKDESDKEIERIRHDYYSKIFAIIEGQSNVKLTNEVNKELGVEPYTKEYHDRWYDIWAEKFDGSGIEGWWD